MYYTYIIAHAEMPLNLASNAAILCSNVLYLGSQTEMSQPLILSVYMQQSANFGTQAKHKNMFVWCSPTQWFEA